jgi:hypothetical protein
VEYTRIRYYVDDEMTASIDMELFMGHGIGVFDGDDDKNSVPWLTKWMGKVGKGNGVHNSFRIPFGQRICVTAERSAQRNRNCGYLDGDDQTPQSWWYIRGCSKMNVALGGMHQLPALARLRLVKLERYTAQPLQEFDLCHIPSGPGALFQVTIAAQSTSLSFLEACTCMRAYVGSNKTENPMFLSSGLEDYFTAPTILIAVNTMEILCRLDSHFDKAKHNFSAYSLS